MAHSKNDFRNRLKLGIKQALTFKELDVNTNIEQTNSKYKYFNGLGVERDKALNHHSATTKKNPWDGKGFEASIDQSYADLVYATMSVNKVERLNEWKEIAAFAEVSDALDEICDDFISLDDEGRCSVIKWSRSCKLTMDHRQTIQDEFDKFVVNMELQERGWEYCRKLLTEGEVFIEHIIHEDYPEEGIIGSMVLNNEVIDPIYTDHKNNIIDGFLYKRMRDDNGHLEQATQIETEAIPFNLRQITYIHSGVWDETGQMKVAFIENARRAYRQLSLIEDSIVIYRLVRAPERLVFNVDVGNLNGPESEQYINGMIQKYWSSKTFDGNVNDTVKKFKPQSMLDAFWFAKREGSDGTDVKQLPGGANLGELSDLNYFHEKLYHSLKVPTTRLSKENTHKDGTEVLREELKFARFIIRLQQKVGTAFKSGFITHLKMRGLFDTDEYKIKLQDFNIELLPPANFHELRKQQTLQIKISNYNDFTASESISAIYGQIKYLDWDKKTIEDNIKSLKKDAALAFELDQIRALGPNWQDVAAQEAAADTNAASGGAAGGGFGGGDFGDDDVPGFGEEAAIDNEDTSDIPAGDDASFVSDEGDATE